MIRFFLVLVIGGLAAAVGYPVLVQNFSGTELGSIPLYERGKGFLPATITLSPKDAPIRLIVRMTSIGQPVRTNARTVLGFKLTGPDGRTLDRTLEFVEAGAGTDRDASADERQYQADAGLLEPSATGDWSVELVSAAREEIKMKSVSLDLRSNAGAIDPRVQPLGFVAATLGILGVFLGLRRRASRATPPPAPKPPARKWGR